MQPLQIEEGKDSGEMVLSNSRLTHKAYQAQRYMPSLDGLRAIAVALVITCHLHADWGFLSGFVGVTIFFVLSGYLITRLALQEEREKGRLNVIGFYIRRTFRIFPLYYFVLFFYAILVLHFKLWPLKIRPFLSSLPYYLTYLQEIPFWRSIASKPPFYHSWSLGIEEKFYLIWPIFLASIAQSRLERRFMLVAICAVLFIAAGIASWGRYPYHMEYYGFILLGAMLAMALSSSHAYIPVANAASKIAPAALVVLLITQFLLMPHTALYFLTSIYAASVTVLLAALVTSDGAAKRLLSFAPLVRVGQLSYGIYLIHILCLSVVEKIAKPGHGRIVAMLAYLGTLALSIAISCLLHYTLERPMISLGKRLSAFSATETAAVHS